MRTQNYSKGMRQKLGLAIALIKDAPNILLDEPTSGLDPKSGQEFLNLLLIDAGPGEIGLHVDPRHLPGEAHRRPRRVHEEGAAGDAEDQRRAQGEDLTALYIQYMDESES